MRFEPVDRLSVVEWAHYWDQTLARWHAEGLPAELTDSYDIRRYFGLDSFRQLWIAAHVPTRPEPACHGAGLVGSMDEYRGLKEHLYPEVAFDAEVLARWAAEHEHGDTVIWFTLLGFFWYPRELLGIERHLYTFYDDPELLHAMNRDLIEYNLRVLDRLCRICTPDFMTFAEDMCYNHGPMLSRKCFDEFLAPYYNEIVPALKSRGVIPFVDCDGDVTAMIPWLEDIVGRRIAFSFPLPPGEGRVRGDAVGIVNQENGS